MYWLNSFPTQVWNGHSTCHPSDVEKVQDSAVTLTCRPPYSKPAANVTWFKDNQEYVPRSGAAVLGKWTSQWNLIWNWNLCTISHWQWDLCVLAVDVHVYWHISLVRSDGVCLCTSFKYYHTTKTIFRKDQRMPVTGYISYQTLSASRRIISGSECVFNVNACVSPHVFLLMRIQACGFSAQ